VVAALSDLVYITQYMTLWYQAFDKAHTKRYISDVWIYIVWNVKSWSGTMYWRGNKLSLILLYTQLRSGEHPLTHGVRNMNTQETEQCSHYSTHIMQHNTLHIHYNHYFAYYHTLRSIRQKTSYIINIIQRFHIRIIILWP
jgi:hypothetical protein